MLSSLKNSCSREACEYYEITARVTSKRGEETRLNAFLRLLLQVLQLLGNLLDDSGGQRLCSLQLMQVA